MLRILLSCALFLFVTASCSVIKNTSTPSSKSDVQLDTIPLFDEARQREIPIATYQSSITSKGIVVFNHGYGANYQQNYLIYSYLTRSLAQKGYFVVSIQHELPTDSLLPTSGIPKVVRLPFWERGVENILFTLNELKKSHPTLNFEHITLIGHSNGGDMVALYPTIHPNEIAEIITLDHLRVPLPRTNDINVLSLRSNDKKADEGVLPTIEEQQEFQIKIIKLTHVNHNDMNDFAKKKQKKIILNYIDSFMSR